MKFNYEARSKDGKVQSGVVEATSKEAALALLQKHDLYITFLEQEEKSLFIKDIQIFSRVTTREVVMFTRQFSIMFRSNVPVVESLQTLAHQTTNVKFKENIFKVAEEIEGGATLSQGLALFPEIFSEFYVSMVKSGEVSGKLSESLDFLADYLEREHNLTAQMISSLTYPAFVIFVFLIIGFLMGTMVVPQLTMVLEGSDADLPWVTNAVIAGASFLQVYWWLVILVFVGFGVFLFQFLRTKEGKALKDKLSLELPVIGPFFKKIYLARTAMNLSTLISGGLPIAQALEVTSSIVGNEVYREAILEAREAVVGGQPISSAFANYPKIFSPLFIQMTIVGERTGNLGTVLVNIVDFYQKDVERAMESFMKIFEPALILILGVLVAGLAAALLMPLYGSIQSF